VRSVIAKTQEKIMTFGKSEIGSHERLSVYGKPAMPWVLNGLARYWWATIEIMNSVEKDSRVGILDISCGDGYGSDILASIPNAYVLGVDNDKDSIYSAMKHHSYTQPWGGVARFVVFSLEHFLFFNREVFDYVVSLETLEHVDDLQTCLKGLCSIAKKGVIFSFPNREASGNNPFHKHFGLTEKTCAQTLHEAGFKFQSFGQFEIPDSRVFPLIAFPSPERPWNLLFHARRKL
jgi:ubiquinone/menaquinone biosynthesis C-methylase UbiE